MTMIKNIRRAWPFMVGTLFFAAALSILIFNKIEDKRAQAQVGAVLQQLHETTEIREIPQETNVLSTESYKTIPNSVEIDHFIPDYILNPNMDMPTVEVDGNSYIGTLYFPSLQVELPVISAWSYPNLKIAPCLYTGSIYTGNAVVAAHNYTSHFWHLFSLSPTDKVLFTDTDGNVFTYEVVLQEVLEPTAIEDMTTSSYDLSLFTCTLGGISRFTVRCRLL